MGPLIARHRFRPLNRRDLLTHVLPGTIAILAPLAYGLYRSDYGLTHYGQVAANTWGQPWFNLSLVAVLVFAWLLIFRLAASLRYVALHKNGIVIASPNKKSLRWGQISGVTLDVEQTRLLGVRLRTRYHGVLLPSVGKPIHLSSGYKNLPELLTYIKAKLYPRLLEALQTGFENGQRLHFGPLSIHKSDLQVTSDHMVRAIPWTKVDTITIQSGFLMIQSKDQTRLRFNVSDIPNIELLLHLIQTGVST